MESIWVQLLVEFFGAFLGFLFATLLAGLSGIKEKKRKYNLVLDCLIDELHDIIEPLEKYIDNNMILNSRIAIPTWEALQYSGMTLDLIGKDYFDNLVTAYALIKAYNEDRLFENKISVSRLSEIVKVCKEALAQIEAERK